MNPKLARRMRRLSEVPRWTVIPTIRNQNVAEHSFHVAWIVRWLATEYHKHPDLGAHVIDVNALTVAALFHDETEAISGDLPTPYKRQMGETFHRAEERRLGLAVDNLPSIEKAILKLADIYEAALFVDEEVNLGNRRLARISTDLRAKMEEVHNTIHVFAEASHFFELFGRFHRDLEPVLHPVLETESKYDEQIGNPRTRRGVPSSMASGGSTERGTVGSSEEEHARSCGQEETRGAVARTAYNGEPLKTISGVVPFPRDETGEDADSSE